MGLEFRGVNGMDVIYVSMDCNQNPVYGLRYIVGDCTDDNGLFLLKSFHHNRSRPLSCAISAACHFRRGVQAGDVIII